MELVAGIYTVTWDFVLANFFAGYLLFVVLFICSFLLNTFNLMFPIRGFNFDVYVIICFLNASLKECNICCIFIY